MLDAAFEWIENQRVRVERDLTQLCEINSGSRNLPGLNRCADWLIQNVTISSADFQAIDLPASVEVDDGGNHTSYKTGAALQWTIRARAAKRILLAIHYDTVFGPDHPFQAVKSLDEYRLRGPGVADAKGGILCIRTAIEALEKFGLAPDLGLTILLNPDEEIGSPHSSRLMEQIAKCHNVGLLFEPSLPSGELVGTRGGSGNYSIVIRGRAAHVGRHFGDGRNAVARLCELMAQLDSLNSLNEGLIINAGFVRGGGALNVVPNIAIGRINVRVSDADQITWFESFLKAEIAKIKSMDGYEVEVMGGISSPPKILTQKLEELQSRIELAFEQVVTSRVKWIHTQGVCDGNKLAAAGLTNVDSLGPVGGGLHSEKEWVDLPSILDRAKIVVSILAKMQDEAKEEIYER